MRFNIQVNEKIADDWVSTNVIHEKQGISLKLKIRKLRVFCNDVYEFE